MTAREIYDLALRGGGNDFQATVELLERLCRLKDKHTLTKKEISHEIPTFG